MRSTQGRIDSSLCLNTAVNTASTLNVTGPKSKCSLVFLLFYWLMALHGDKKTYQVKTTPNNRIRIFFFFLLDLPSFIYNSGKITSIKMRLRLFLTDVHCWPDPKSIDVNEKTPWGFGLGSNCWKN